MKNIKGMKSVQTMQLSSAIDVIRRNVDETASDYYKLRKILYNTLEKTPLYSNATRSEKYRSIDFILDNRTGSPESILIKEIVRITIEIVPGATTKIVLNQLGTLSNYL